MYFTIMDDDRAFGETLKNKLESEYHAVVDVYHGMIDLDHSQYQCNSQESNPKRYKHYYK